MITDALQNLHDNACRAWHRDLLVDRLAELEDIAVDAAVAFQPYIANEKIRDSMLLVNKLFQQANQLFDEGELDYIEDRLIPRLESGLIALRGAAMQLGVMPQYTNRVMVVSNES